MNPLDPRCVIFLALLIAAAPVQAQQLRRAPDDKPNIVFVMADDLGYGHLGCYGQQRIMTPRIDRLAAEGMRFTQAYAGNSLCAPSRSALMTGLHMGHAPVRSNSGGVPLRPEDVTWAEVLRDAGYTVGGFGKWGLGEMGTTGVPYRQGFDEFFGYYHQIHAHFYYPSFLWKNELHFPLTGNLGGGRMPGHAGGQRTQYAPDVVRDAALNFARANADRPFALYWSPIIPHVELVVPPDDPALELYRGKLGPETQANDPRDGYVDPREPRATLAAMITHLDTNVGMLVDQLDELGLTENTIIFVTSDNGAQGGPYVGDTVEFFNASGGLRDTKGSMYEGGLRVPMVVRWPGQVPAGRVNDEFYWSFPDVMPTFAELAGGEPPEGIDGVSVVPALRGKRQPPKEFLYWELGSAEYADAPPTRQAVRLGEWKGIRDARDAPLELYNLAIDPAEQREGAAANPETGRRIERIMTREHTPMRPQVEPLKVQGQPYYWLPGEYQH